MKTARIWTDGGCWYMGSTGTGGWAAIIERDEGREEISSAVRNTTNNRMELTAAIEGLKRLVEPHLVQIFTDSQYLRLGITVWINNWKRNGWVVKRRRLVKNRDLWEELDRLSGYHRIEWQWVKGHSGHAQNERCDVLAGKAIRELNAVAV